MDKPSEVEEVAEGHDLSATINEDARYKSLVAKIKALFTTAYISASKQCLTFEHLKKVQSFLSLLLLILTTVQMYLENRSITPESLLKGAITLQDFRSMLSKYQNQIQEISEMETSLLVEGILLVDTQDLKDLFLPSPSACIMAISKALPDLARQKATSLAEQISFDSNKLASSTRTVSECVEYLACVREITAKMAKYDESYTEIEDMYVMMDENSVIYSAEDKSAFQALQPAILHLRADVDHAASHKHESILNHAFLSLYNF